MKLAIPEAICSDSLSHVKLGELPPEAGNELMLEFWKQMTVGYQNRWAQGEYGGDLSRLWFEGLSEFTPAGMAYAVERTAAEAKAAILTGATAWPPGLVEIQAYAEQYDKRYRREQAMAQAQAKPKFSVVRPVPDRTRQHEVARRTRQREVARGQTQALLANLKGGRSE